MYLHSHFIQKSKSTHYCYKMLGFVFEHVMLSHVHPKISPPLLHHRPSPVAVAQRQGRRRSASRSPAKCHVRYCFHSSSKGAKRWGHWFVCLFLHLVEVINALSFNYHFLERHLKADIHFIEVVWRVCVSCHTTDGNAQEIWSMTWTTHVLAIIRRRVCACGTSFIYAVIDFGICPALQSCFADTFLISFRTSWHCIVGGLGSNRLFAMVYIRPLFGASGFITRAMYHSQLGCNSTAQPFCLQLIFFLGGWCISAVFMLQYYKVSKITVDISNYPSEHFPRIHLHSRVPACWIYSFLLDLSDFVSLACFRVAHIDLNCTSISLRGNRGLACLIRTRIRLHFRIDRKGPKLCWTLLFRFVWWKRPTGRKLGRAIF